MKRIKHGRKGSATVEAAIALPVFLCAVISIVMLAKVVYVHGMIAHALTETADEMASAGYLYHISGLQDIHDSVRDGLQERTDVFKGQMDTIIDTFGNLTNADLGSIPDDAGDLQGIADDAVSDPIGELKNIASYFAGGVFDGAKTKLFTPLAKLCMEKYLETGTKDADSSLRALNVADGFDGLDFGESSFFEDSDENIDIVVRYTIELPIPINVLPKLELVQRATARAWLGGDEASAILDGATDDIWSLGNFERGAKFREKYGANLPYNFPVISSFEGGKVTMIKSMDLTAASYQNSETVMKTIDSYIKELSDYRGQEKAWGSQDIVIKGTDIKQRELLLVIPKNQLPAEVEQLLSRYASRAAASEVSFKLVRYGVGANESQSDTSDSEEG